MVLLVISHAAELAYVSPAIIGLHTSQTPLIALVAKASFPLADELTLDCKQKHA